MSNPKNLANQSWYRGIERLKHGIMSEIRCAQIAKVIRYDAKKHVADIQPLANMSDGQPSAQYLDVPVSANCYEVDELVDHARPGEGWLAAHGVTLPKKHLMRTGAIVLTMILDRDNDNWDGSGQNYMPNTSRLHDENDAIVIGVLGDDIY